ncbi:TetR/AcrR family transcriptional regulator [Novosphingobium profundi]|uniref:TetR/AcrR family transcriptional regulator n=1 Tax=Novosphingobium profundi TaxID=1774954 RepID=UPI001FE8C3B1|nr:TetR/AcrR family transcriptional regulator [Novosphingobium profundi]
MDKVCEIGESGAMNTQLSDLEADFERAGVPPAQQARSRTLRDELIRLSLEIARRRSFDDVGIVEICREAGCSTGAFYSRFPDKLTLFKAVMVKAAAESRPMLEAIVRETPFEQVLTRLVAEQVRRFHEQETFFRSAFRVSLADSEAWQPFRRNAHDLASAYVERVREEPSFASGAFDEGRIRFAFQVMYGVLNNTVSQKPGPYHLTDPEFPGLLEVAMRATMGLGV